MRRALLYATSLLWLVTVCAGMGKLWDYENTAGVSARSPSSWPADSRIQRVPDRATLVLFAHPHCPCTRATLDELDFLMVRCTGHLAASVLFYRPSASPNGWEKTDLWRRAAAIPDVSVLCDVDGMEARRFDAATSGQAFLYDKDGRVLFCGGITGARALRRQRRARHHHITDDREARGANNNPGLRLLSAGLFAKSEE